MERVAKALVETRFKWLCDVLGKSVGKNQGDWDLLSERGGRYEIVEYLENRAIHHPFGHETRSGKDMLAVIDFALRAIQIDREPDSCSYWPKDKSALALGPKMILVKAKEWWDKANGNSYFSARILVDGKLIGVLPIQYGFGNHFEYEALKLLKERKILDSDVGHLWQAEGKGVILEVDKIRNCKKREVEEFGAV